MRPGSASSLRSVSVGSTGVLLKVHVTLAPSTPTAGGKASVKTLGSSVARDGTGVGGVVFVFSQAKVGAPYALMLVAVSWESDSLIVYTVVGIAGIGPAWPG